MGRAPVSGREAKRYTRIAQVAGLALAASAAVLLAVEVPMLGVRETPIEELVPPSGLPGQPAGATPAPQREFVADDMTGIDERLATARVAPPKKPEPTATAGTAATETPAETAPAQTGWRYLGSVIEPNRRIALLSIDGRQRMVAEGREVNGIRLVSVGENGVVVEEQGSRRKIDRETRQGSPVAWVTMPEPAAPMPGANGAMADPAAAEDYAARRSEVMGRAMSREERMKRAEEFRARAREARRARERGESEESIRQRMMEAEEVGGE